MALYLEQKNPAPWLTFTHHLKKTKRPKKKAKHFGIDSLNYKLRQSEANV